MKRQIGILCLVVAVGIISEAALAPPDLSGTWIRDKFKSDPTMKAIRVSKSGEQVAELEFSMVIDQEGNNLRVATRVDDNIVLEVLYKLDGTETSASVDQGEIISSAKWHGDKLIIDKTSKFGEREEKSKEQWSLSPDGKVLTITAIRYVPQGAQTTKQTYNRK